MSTEQRINNWIRWLSKNHHQVETRLIIYRNQVARGGATKGAEAILVRRIHELRGWLDVIEQEVTGEEWVAVRVEPDLLHQIQQLAPQLGLEEIVNSQALPLWLQMAKQKNS